MLDPLIYVLFSFLFFLSLLVVKLVHLRVFLNLQSQERARKLRGDLAEEEHRGQELSRILKELLPDPKTSNAPKSRQGRKVGCLIFFVFWVIDS